MTKLLLKSCRRRIQFPAFSLFQTSHFACPTKPSLSSTISTPHSPQNDKPILNNPCIPNLFHYLSAPSSASGSRSSHSPEMLRSHSTKTSRSKSPDAAKAACLIRLQRDLDDVADLRSEGVLLTFPNPSDIQRFIMRIIPQSGIWRGSAFDFDFRIPDNWPNTRPQVKVLTRVWHPNIAEPEAGGGVCLNILKKNYTPVIQINQFVQGLQFLFQEPNPNDPLNLDAAQQFRQNYTAFKLKSEEYMRLYCPAV
jgi:ubiquitin-protein ligase